MNFSNPDFHIQVWLTCASLRSAAFVNGQRQGRTSEKPFKMGDSITKEMQKDQFIPELNVVSELELSARTLREAEAEARQSSSSSDEQKQFIDKKMVDLGMTRYTC